MLRFHGRLFLQTPVLLWDSAKKWDAITGVATLCLWGLGVKVEWIPWWAVFMPILFLFLYGLMKVNYEKFQKVEGRARELEGKLATAAKRKAFRDLLGVAYGEGERLYNKIVYPAEGYKTHSLKAETVAWRNRVHDLIEDTLDTAEAKLFLTEVDGSVLEQTRSSVELEVWLDDRLARLESLIEKTSSLGLRPHFNHDEYSQDWISR